MSSFEPFKEAITGILKLHITKAELLFIQECCKSIISRDIAHIRQQSRHNIRKYIDEMPPEEYEKCLVGLTAILMEAWNTSQQAEERRCRLYLFNRLAHCN
jgi:hypothetical protein